MKYKLIVRPEAEAQLAEAYAWYDQQVAGLGDHFLLSDDAAIHSIKRNPLQYPIVHKDIRRALTRRFPFQILFIIDERDIIVIAVFHGMRNPAIWRSRN